MKTFKFDQDIKMTIWERHSFEIEANSKEEALSKLMSEIGEHNNNEYSLSEPLFDGESVYMYHTSEYLPLEENNGQPTIDILDGDGNSVWNNVEGEIK